MLRDAAADEELAPGRLEQAARRVGRRRGGRRRARPAAPGSAACGACAGGRGCLRVCGAGRGEAEQERSVVMANRRMHTVSAYRMKNWPDGWFEPWMFEWQFTHDRPNIRLLLLVVIWSLS